MGKISLTNGSLLILTVQWLSGQSATVRSVAHPVPAAGDSVPPVALPDHQVDEEGDEGDGAQRQNHDQGVGRIRERHLLLGAAEEEGGVRVQEVVLHGGVGVVAVQNRTQTLQADGQAVVGPAATGTSIRQVAPQCYFIHSLKHYSIH